MYDWVKNNCASERKPDQTEEQFIYSARKKALGAFKKDIVSLPKETKDAIASEIEKKFEFLFEKLNVKDTKDLTSKYITLKRVISRKREVSKEIELSHEGAD
jgi:hypothetical protein